MLHCGFVEYLHLVCQSMRFNVFSRSDRHKKLLCYCHMFIELCSHFVSKSLAFMGWYYLPFTAWQALTIPLLFSVLLTNMRPFLVVKQCIGNGYSVEILALTQSCRSGTLQSFKICFLILYKDWLDTLCQFILTSRLKSQTSSIYIYTCTFEFSTMFVVFA